MTFPPPWSVEDRAAAFAVCDALAYVISRIGRGGERPASLLSKDEAQRRMKLGHHLSGGAQGPDPVQALLQAGPPDAVQPPPAAAASVTR